MDNDFKPQWQYHPFIEGLKVNEYGSEVIHFGKALKVHTITKSDYKRVIVNGKKIGVMKLVMEAWNGERPSVFHRCVKIDQTAGIHYTNLKWEENAETVKQISRKLTDDQEDEIYERILKGETRQEIANSFGLNKNTITSIKKRVEKRHGKKNH